MIREKNPERLREKWEGERAPERRKEKWVHGRLAARDGQTEMDSSGLGSALRQRKTECQVESGLGGREPRAGELGEVQKS